MFQFQEHQKLCLVFSVMREKLNFDNFWFFIIFSSRNTKILLIFQCNEGQKKKQKLIFSVMWRKRANF